MTSIDILNDLLNITQNYDLLSHELIRKQVAFSYKIYLMLWSSALVMCTAGVFVPFINHKLPYKVWFPFETDIEKNELGFWVASFLVVFNSFFGSAIDMALDILPVTFMAFAIGLLNELSERIKKVRTYDDLVQCVVIHRKIKLFVNEIYENFATAIFIQGIMSSLILCTGVFTMSVTKSTADFIQITTFIIPMVLEIFLPCYFGNELSIASSELTSSMFQSKWIEGDSKLKKTLMIFMECNRKELRLTALGWFEINIPTFTNTRCNRSEHKAICVHNLTVCVT
ncbi:CLUMA_CG016006, isoform A [Clunio marinus]|uniref:CLUMA_CG016006, isoform A n=1 Tax=Clunio marinus TaxID=568069 RepID=A0A1J1IRC9_9DIPT|nr:CLUMA_CG016006, isoform A [Clunio marinus]